MNRTFLLLVALAFSSLGFAQQYQVLVEKPGEKTYKGIISRQTLTSDTSFHWYADNLKGYAPNSLALSSLRKQADSVELLVFMGTWCHDSQFIIPKMYSLIDAADFKESRVTLIGVDREKKTLSHLAEALNITNVPTIMVMKNGKEIGRVVEYGKYGLFDKELGEILNSLDNH
jgi:thiol-disulfide isomerase/thioredoxin